MGDNSERDIAKLWEECIAEMDISSRVIRYLSEWENIPYFPEIEFETSENSNEDVVVEWNPR